VRNRLVEFFGADRPIDRITAGDAEDFRLHLARRLATATVNKTSRISKQIFESAIRHGLIETNFFAGLP
jgi:hypothetical protein